MDVSSMLHYYPKKDIPSIMIVFCIWLILLILKDTEAGLFHGKFRWNYWQNNSCCTSFWITTRHPTAAYSKALLPSFPPYIN